MEWIKISDQLPKKRVYQTCYGDEEDNRYSEQVLLCVLCHNEIWEENDRYYYIETSDFYYGYFDAIYDYKWDSWRILNKTHNSVSDNGVCNGTKAEYTNLSYFDNGDDWVKPYAWAKCPEPPSDIESALYKFEEEHDTWQEGYCININE